MAIKKYDDLPQKLNCSSSTLPISKLINYVAKKKKKRKNPSLIMPIRNIRSLLMREKTGIGVKAKKTNLSYLFIADCMIQQ